jgi:hypothetical protein
VGGADLGSPTFTYNGSSVVPVNAGSYAVVGSFAGNANYHPALASGATILITYSWSSVLSPIHQDGSSIFKLGSTVPVKFRLAGAAVTNLAAKIFVAKVSGGILGTWEMADSTSAADSGNTFRYDSSGGQYIFNLSTKGLSTGTWQIGVDLGDGGPRHTVLISLK